MFKLRIRNLNETYGGGKENLAADFLQAIGFLGTDGPYRPSRLLLLPNLEATNPGCRQLAVIPRSFTLLASS